MSTYKIHILKHEEDRNDWCVLIKLSEVNFDNFKEALINRIPSLKNKPLNMFYRDYSHDKVILNSRSDIELFFKVETCKVLFIVTHPKNQIWSYFTPIVLAHRAVETSTRPNTSETYKNICSINGLNFPTTPFLPENWSSSNRYRAYTPEDMKKAMEAVKAGMDMLQSARIYRVPCRTLCDNLKRSGFQKILTGSQPNENTGAQGDINGAASPSKNGSQDREWVVIDKNNDVTENKASAVEETTDEQEMIDYSEAWRTYQEERQNSEVDESIESESDTTETASIIDDSKYQAPVSLHSNPRINEALITLADMGFKNDDGSLTELLEMVEGNMSDVLQLLLPLK